jgi:cytochrome c2
MKARHVRDYAALALCASVLGGCESSSSSAPPISAAFVRAGVRENADAHTLALGRSLLLNRCIQCHRLPEVAQFDRPHLTAIVAKMSGRANMNAEQHEALLKYLLTVQSQ